MQNANNMIWRFITTLIMISCLSNIAIAQDKLAVNPALDAAIHDYIMRHPQVIREALEKAALDEQVERTKRILREQSDAIYRSGSPTMGRADAKVSIVEFFDYNCPYCRKSHPLVHEFVADNPDVRIVLKDIANLGKESEAISRLVIAARRQGKFEPLHEALMGRQGRTTEIMALDAARKIGIDIEILKRDAASPETARVLAATRELASSLSVEGTPLFIIGHNGIAGTPDNWMGQLAKFVTEIRKSGCDVC